MSNWFEKHITANNIKIHYHRSGAPGKPPLLLLHGITDSGRVWARVAGELADEYDIVMTDARGHGQSADLASGFSLQLLAADAAAVISSLDLHQPYVWGHSMGAITAMVLAASYPNMVRAAVLEDPPLLYPQALRELVAGSAQADRPQSPDFRTLFNEERLSAARAMNPTWHEAELAPWAESKAQVDPAVYRYFYSVPDFPWQETLARIACPTLLLTGDPEAGAVVTPAVAQEAQGLLRQGQLTRIAGSGHNIHRDAYERTIAEVRAFLQSH